MRKDGGQLSRLRDPITMRYPLSWQNEWFHHLVQYVKDRGLTAEGLASQLRERDFSSAREELQRIVKPKSDRTKIIDCWIRDVLRVDSFPIDERVHEVPGAWNIEPDPLAIVDCCRKLDIADIRPFARAVYSNSDYLIENAEWLHRQVLP